MDNNTQLPVEVVKEIEKKASELYPLSINKNQDWGLIAHQRKIWAEGATSYATKLQAAEEKIKVLNFDNTRMKRALEGYKEAVDELKKVTTEGDKQRKEANDQLREAKKLLNEVFRKHETGLLPDRFIYEKIKTFLYGE